MNKDLPKAYSPREVEDEIYRKWEESGFFNPDVCVKEGFAGRGADYFSMVLPPPNVTGTLHMGHAAMLAIEDVMARYQRMVGKRTWWIPGTDHAAIATQTKVEKLLLEKRGETRQDLGREKFLKEVAKFAQQSHDIIINQTKKMGASLDWSNEAYTLDEIRSRAVRMVFKKMYDDGLIYRGDRVVNWCPRCHSTLADDEVEYRETPGKLYTFKYDKDFPIAIATTRPETKLGDTAVAVNPKDERYKKYLGKSFKVNFCGQELNIKIISDREVDMAYGTGALGVTPAHSQTDFAMAEKNNLEVKKIIDEDGRMINVGEFNGLTATEARSKVIAKLKEQGLLEKEEDIKQNLSLCYRCSSVIEPLTSLQWFIDVNKKIKIPGNKYFAKGASLKEVSLKVVREGEIKIIPERFNKIYFNWMENLRDWCISRQIWFGHQIPVWHKKSKVGSEEIYVGIEPPSGEGWTQEEDTLDTWFSSGLWTFSTMLGDKKYEDLEEWIKNSPKLKEYHPTSMMETGYDIIFFWVARMIIMTTYVMGEIPFKEVYLHGLVRDDKGQKMSKSLGNVIDPLDMIAKYGADATRLSLLIGATPGNDVKLNEKKIAGFRNFTNKLWNISRYIFMSVEDIGVNTKNLKPATLADRWVLSRFNKLKESYTYDLDNYHFSRAGESLRDFTWGELADWYLEISKIEQGKDQILTHLLKNLLRMWHPFMPFVTEELWKNVASKHNLMVSHWPATDQNLIDEEAERHFEIIREIITSIRNARSEFRVPPAKKLKLVIKPGKQDALLKENEAIVRGLARLESIGFGAKPEGAVVLVVGAVELYLDLGGIIDTEKEKERLGKELNNLEQYIRQLKKKLGNKDFVKNAPEKIVETERQKLSEVEEKLSKLNAQLKTLK